MGLEPTSVCLSVHAFTLSNMNISETSWLAEGNQILSEAIFGWGKGCTRFTVISIGSFCQVYRVTDEALIAETAVWLLSYESFL